MFEGNKGELPNEEAKKFVRVGGAAERRRLAHYPDHAGDLGLLVTVTGWGHPTSQRRDTMKNFMISSAAVALMACAPAYAGNLSAQGLDDPHVAPMSSPRPMPRPERPDCVVRFLWIFEWPCYEAGPHVSSYSSDDGPNIELPIDDGPRDDGPGDDGPGDDGPGDDDNPSGQPSGQNPGNDKPVGGSPFDGERGEEPSGVDKD